MKTPEKSNHYYTSTIRFFDNWFKRQELPYRYTRGRRLIKPIPSYKFLYNHKTATRYRRYVIRSHLTGRIRCVEPNISTKPQQRSALDIHNMILDIARNVISKDLESDRENKEKENDKT